MTLITRINHDKKKCANKYAMCLAFDTLLHIINMLRNGAIIYTFPAVMIIFSLLYAILSWACSSLPFSHFYRHHHEDNSRLQNDLAERYLRSAVDDDSAGLHGLEAPQPNRGSIQLKIN